jgi:ribonuclease III
MRADLAGIEARLGYWFRDRGLLLRALTHKSYCFDEAGALHNEQLEFFGDSILGFLVSEYLVERFPEIPEGELSKHRAQIISASHLHAAAMKLDLGAFLVLGRGEEMSGGRSKKTLLGDAMEAIVAALYVDGGMEAARAFVRSAIIPTFPEVSVRRAPSDFKTELQELAQAMRLPLPRYIVVHESGPEHDKTFTIEARLGPAVGAQATGPSKKSAGQSAARMLLDRLRADIEPPT